MTPRSSHGTALALPALIAPIVSIAVIALGVGVLTTPAEARPPKTELREAGPIWNDGHAKRRCPQVCQSGAWTGHWKTTISGRMSVCQCALPERAARRARRHEPRPTWHRQPRADRGDRQVDRARARRQRSVDARDLGELTIEENGQPARRFYKIGPDRWAETRLGRGHHGRRTYQVESRSADRLHLVSLERRGGRARRLTVDLADGRTELQLFSGSTLSGTVSDRRADERGHDGLIQIPGTREKVSPQRLERDLRDKGFSLVKTSRLRPNECAVVYPRADAQDISADFAVLSCAVKVGDHVSLQTTAIHGGCDASDVRKQGAGGACSVGIAHTELTVDFPGGSTRYTVQGPNAHACSSLSTERVCAGMGAEVASASFHVADSAGNGIGLGVSKGVGYGLNGGYEKGIISFGVDLSFIAGGSVNVSINPVDVTRKVGRGAVEGATFVGKGAVEGGKALGKGAKAVGKGVGKAAEETGKFFKGLFD